MIQQPNAIMKVKHASGPKHSVNMQTDGIHEPMLNLPMQGSLLMCRKALGTLWAEPVEKIGGAREG